MSHETQPITVNNRDELIRAFRAKLAELKDHLDNHEPATYPVTITLGYELAQSE